MHWVSLCLFAKRTILKAKALIGYGRIEKLFDIFMQKDVYIKDNTLVYTLWVLGFRIIKGIWLFLGFR